jgi:hypothetical protein
MSSAGGIIRAGTKRWATALKDSFKADAAYFHAKPFLDWNPFVRFSHRCSSFIFCSPEATKSQFSDWLDQAPEGDRLSARNEPLVPFGGDLGEYLPFQDGEAPWIGRATVTRKIGGITREIRAYVFKETAPVVYKRLVQEYSRAPSFLSLLDDDPAPDANGNFPLINWDAALREVVFDEGGVKPEYLIAPKNAVCPPWNALWQHYPNWDLRNTAAFSRSWPSDATQRVTRISASRTVEVKTWPLTPLKIEDANAVFMEVDQFHRHDWPDKLLKIVSIAPECFDEHIRNEDANLIALDLFGVNMPTALRELDAICEEHKIKSLASIPFGFPDEGAELDHWASQDGPGPQKLTFYADLPGDYTSLVSQCARDKEAGD